MMKKEYGHRFGWRLTFLDYFFTFFNMFWQLEEFCCFEFCSYFCKTLWFDDLDDIFVSIVSFLFHLKEMRNTTFVWPKDFCDYVSFSVKLSCIRKTKILFWFSWNFEMVFDSFYIVYILKHKITINWF